MNWRCVFNQLASWVGWRILTLFAVLFLWSDSSWKGWRNCRMIIISNSLALLRLCDDILESIVFFIVIAIGHPGFLTCWEFQSFCMHFTAKITQKYLKKEETHSQCEFPLLSHPILGQTQNSVSVWTRKISSAQKVRNCGTEGIVKSCFCFLTKPPWLDPIWEREQSENRCVLNSARTCNRSTPPPNPLTSFRPPFRGTAGPDWICVIAPRSLCCT